jgi:hypothetical protein
MQKTTYLSDASVYIDKRMNEIKAQLKQERRAEAYGEDEA